MVAEKKKTRKPKAKPKARVGPPKHVLPARVAKLVRVADKDPKEGRFALDGVHVAIDKDAGFVVTATDCKAVIRVSNADPDKFRTHRETSVPRGTWNSAFCAGSDVPVRISNDERSATLQGFTADAIAGKFPPVDEVIKRVRSQVKFKGKFDAALLAKVLSTMASMAGDEQVVELCFDDSPVNPIYLVDKHEELIIEALVMPIA